MASKAELKEMLRQENISDVLRKHHEIDELYSFLDIMHERDYYYDAENVLRSFPSTKEYDSVKINFLLENNSKVSPFVVSEIIRLIVDDNTKLMLLERFEPTFEKNYYIINVIHSLANDKLKKEKFREYINLYDDEDFSDYLRRIKDDELRMEEFVLYKDRFPNYNLDWFASAFKTDEKKKEVFDKYYDDTKQKYVINFSDCFDNDDNIISFISQYSNKIDFKKISYLSFNTPDGIIKFIAKFSEKITPSFLSDLINRIGDKDKVIELLDTYCDKISSKSLFDIIYKIGGKKNLLELYERYIDYLNGDAFRCLLIYIDEDKTTSIFDKYVYRYLDSLPTIWNSCRKGVINGLSCDHILDNHIDSFDMLGFAYILDCHVNYSYKSINIVYELLARTNNFNTIKKIYNAVAFVDPKFFLEHFYNDNRLFTDKERDLLNELSGGNPYFFSTFNFSLLEVPVLKNNKYFLPKLAKYPETAERIVNLYHKKPKVINLLLLLIKKVYSYDIYYDFITDKLIDAFFDAKNSFLEEIEIGKLNEEDKISLIYKIINSKPKKASDEEIICDLEIKNNDDIRKYKDNLNNKIDKLYNTFETIDDKKKYLLYKLYGFSLDKANQMVNTYGFSMDKFNDESPLRHIRIIKAILDENDFEKIDSYFNYPELSLEDRLLLEYQIKKEYNRNIKQDLYKIEEHKPLYTRKYEGVDIPIYHANGEFKLLINSLAAYRLKGNIENYDEFWNQNTNVKNHGICCSLISNRNIFQTAPVNDVIIGFSDFSDSTIQLGDCSDIYSLNDDYSLHSIHGSVFMTADDYIDNTRFNHNELVLERKELRKNRSNINLKPSYVVVYDTFDDVQTKKSLKAAKELKVPIVYINTRNILIDECNILGNYYKKLCQEFDINTFNLFFNRYMNNYYGTKNNKRGMTDFYFPPSLFLTEFTTILNNIYNEFEGGIINKDDALNLYNGIYSILNKEIYKTRHCIEKEILDIKPFVETINEYFTKVNEKTNSK